MGNNNIASDNDVMEESINKLAKLLFSLTNEIDFIYTTPSKSDNSEYYYKNSKQFSQIMAKVARFITSASFEGKTDEVYFDCETTTAVWLLSIINKNFCKNNSLSPYRIGYSECFYVRADKRPTRQKDKSILKFRLLNRANFAKSLSRFKIYSKDATKIEYSHYNKVIPILKKYGITV